MVKSHSCSIVLGFVTFLFGIGCVIYIALPLIKYHELEEHDCKVAEVTYPLQMYSNNYTDHWIECDCGKYCKAVTPCVNVYVTIENSTKKYLAYNNYLTYSKKCTFYKYSCKNGENILKVYEEFENAKLIAQSYFNKSLTCYSDSNKNEVYLNNNIDLAIMVCIGLLFCICCCLTCCVYKIE